MRKKITLYLKYLWVSAIILFVSIYFYSHIDLIIKTIDIIPIFNLTIALLALLIAKIFLSYIALLSVQYSNYHMSFFKAFKIYNITQLAKYIPGSIWQFVGKAGAYGKDGMDLHIVKKSIFIEMFFVLMSSFLIGFFLIFLTNIINLDSLYLLFFKYEYIIIIILLIIFLILVFFRRKIKSFYLIFKGNSLLNIRLFVTLTIVWLLLGISFYITIAPFIDNNLLLFLSIIGLYSLSYGVGFLVPFAPAGLGIREAVLVAGISPFVSFDIATILVAMNRVLYIITEVLIVFILIIYSKFSKEKTT